MSDNKAKSVILPAKEGFTFGCDPELFAFDIASGKPIAADFIPGTKAEPHKVPFGAVQRDGMAAEFNIDPVSNFEDFDKNISKVLVSLKNFCPKGVELRAVPSVTFDPEVFANAPDDAKELGCQPDFDAWTGDINPPPMDPDNPFMRCAAGHIHLGWIKGVSLSDPQHILNCRDIVKQLDWYLGGWSIRKDPDPTRRRLYGKAGACRLKDYGVEYRVLSNFWVEKRELRLEVWNRMMTAIEKMSSGFIPDTAGRSYNDLLIESINSTSMNSQLERAYSFPLLTTEEPPSLRRSSKFTIQKYLDEVAQLPATTAPAPEVWADGSLPAVNPFAGGNF